MEQMTLWEEWEPTKSVVNPIWEQLDPVVKMDAVVRLSRLMAKAVSSNHNKVQSKQEHNHEQ
jgi:hypothetical protein